MITLPPIILSALGFMNRALILLTGVSVGVFGAMFKLNTFATDSGQVSNFHSLSSMLAFYSMDGGGIVGCLLNSWMALIPGLVFQAISWGSCLCRRAPSRREEKKALPSKSPMTTWPSEDLLECGALRWEKSPAASPSKENVLETFCCTEIVDDADSDDNESGSLEMYCTEPEATNDKGFR